MLFCCEQSFHGSVVAFAQVFGQTLSVDTLEKTSRRMAAEGEVLLQTLEAPPSAEEGEIAFVVRSQPLQRQDRLLIPPFRRDNAETR